MIVIWFGVSVDLLKLVFIRTLKILFWWLSYRKPSLIKLDTIPLIFSLEQETNYTVATIIKDWK